MFTFIKKMDRNSRKILFTCFFVFFGNGIFSLMMGSAMPDLKATYNLSDTVSGVFLSAHSVGNLVAGFVSGLVPLYLGRRRSIMLLASLAYVGFLMMLLWGNPAWLFVAFVFTGLGRGAVSNFDNQEVNRLSGGNAVGSNLLHASFAIGAILAPMIFLLGRQWFGWRAGLIVVVATGVIVFYALSRMKLDNDKLDRKDKTNSTLSFVKNPSFLILAMMMFCYLCSEYAINGWLVTYIQNKEGLLVGFGVTLEEQLAGVKAYSQSMATLLWGVMLVGRLICASLNGKVAQKIMMMVASFGVAIFFGIMLVSNTIPMVTFAVAGLGLSLAGICPMIYSDGAMFTNTYPMATSVILLFGSTGAIAMPTIVGALAERFGFTGGMSAIFVTVLLLVVFSVLNVVVKRRVPAEYKGN